MERVCAWCGKVMGTGPVGGAVTHGVCLDCLPGLVDMPVQDLSRADEGLLEKLPYGVIRLDDKDRVVAYNMDESHRSRLPREKVLGRSFFTDVAPCTNVQAMAGWVAKARKTGVPARNRLEFVFKFPHGQELVDVGLVYDPGSKLVHILVHATGEEPSRASGSAVG